MFVDHYIIFCMTTKTAPHNVTNLVGHYCKVSDQLGNIHNSKIQFSKGINNFCKQEIERILQMTSSNSLATYLGCSNIERTRQTKGDFDSVKHRLVQNLVD